MAQKKTCFGLKSDNQSKKNPLIIQLFLCIFILNSVITKPERESIPKTNEKATKLTKKSLQADDPIDQNELSHKAVEDFEWFFYRSDQMIDESSVFRDSKSFDGYNIKHFHRNSAGFFQTESKCPENFENGQVIRPVHIFISKFDLYI